MKVAVLYICTGKYYVFWKDFYESANRFLLPGHEKTFFVFSDADENIFAAEDVKVVYQEKLGWPYDTLHRYHMFEKILDDLEQYDYVFFFNANCQFCKTLGDEIFPGEDELLTVVQHPGFYNKAPINFTYDRNERSNAFIPMGQGVHYVAGGVNGGDSKRFVQYIKDMKNAVDDDEQRGVIALWHDESQLNKYILGKKYKLLSPSYCYPEGWNLPFEPIVLIRDKSRYGGHDYLRGVNSSVSDSGIITRFIKAIKKIKFFLSRSC